MDDFICTILIRRDQLIVYDLILSLRGHWIVTPGLVVTSDRDHGGSANVFHTMLFDTAG
jgi:hypothetical protein